MNFDRQPLVLSNDTQVIIRITVPWYEPFTVETKNFGPYKIQLGSILVDGATVILIAAFPLTTKNTPKSEVRQVCSLSGSFETQVQAIQGWETGFVVVSLDYEETAEIAAALVNNMLKKKQAEQLEYAE